MVLKAGLPGFALAMFLILGSVYSLQQMSWMRGLSNEDMISNLRYVMRRTEPNDIVLDGWSGLAAFRPHAWYYAFTHGGVRSAIDKDKLSQFEDDFETGVIAPKLVIMDQHMAEVSPRLTSLIESKYRPTGYGKIWERKQ
jgi:hypothetical protein